MEKEYYADVYFYICPICDKQSVGKAYFAVFEKAEIGAAKRAGLLTYRCSRPECGATYSCDRVMTNGEVVEVPKSEALSAGIAFESKGSA